MAQYFGGPSPRGNTKVVHLAVGASVLVAVYFALADGPAAFALVYLAILPAIVILPLLRVNHEKDLSVPLYTEAFLAGCVLSIAAATFFELIGQLSSGPVWSCEKSPYFTWQCDVAFVIVVILSVGLSEEVAKFLPLSCIKLHARHLPISSFFRLVDTPVGVCLCGCASAAGFATVENIKYTLKSSQQDVMYGVSTAILRAFLAIPFHIACTGYAAAAYGQHGFIVPATLATVREEQPRLTDAISPADGSRSLWSLLRRWWCSPVYQPPSASGGSAIQGSMSATSHYSLLLAGDTSAERQRASASSLIYENLGLWQTLSLLMVPTLAHGLYDSGLFLGAQLLTAAARKDAIGRIPAFLLQIAKSNDDKIYFEVSDGQAALYELTGLLMLALALTAYIVMIYRFAARWRALLKFQCNAIPMQSRLYDCSM